MLVGGGQEVATVVLAVLIVEVHGEEHGVDVAGASDEKLGVDLELGAHAGRVVAAVAPVGGCGCGQAWRGRAAVQDRCGGAAWAL